MKLVSTFVLEVLPYALSALIAVTILPVLLGTQFHGNEPVDAVKVAESTVDVGELVRRDHAAFAPGRVISNLSSGDRTVQFTAK
jgi:hypothetical protein